MHYVPDQWRDQCKFYRPAAFFVGKAVIFLTEFQRKLDFLLVVCSDVLFIK